MVITDEYASATPRGPYGRPRMYPVIMIGASTRAIFSPRPTNPREDMSQPSGLRIANASVVGARMRNTGAASFHFAPRNTAIMSVPNTAHATAIGTVRDKTREYPLRK